MHDFIEFIVFKVINNETILLSIVKSLSHSQNYIVSKIRATQSINDANLVSRCGL
jgi:hypothetical protein